MPEERKSTAEEEGFDPARREMCEDGLCIGVIGPDGRCRVCGKAGKAPAAGAAAAPAADPDPGPEKPADWRPKAPPADDAAPPGGDEDRPDFARERMPCPDGMCTGVVNRSGRCGTCGKPWDWKEP